MLHKIVRGRLGNQMFQYAAMRSMQLKYFPTEKINFNFSLVRRDGEKGSGFDNQLKAFDLCKNIVFDQKITSTIAQKIILVGYFLSYKILKLFVNASTYEDKKQHLEQAWQPIMNKHGLYFMTYGYYSFNFSSTNKEKIFAGFFESTKYFDDIKDELRRDFTPNTPKAQHNENLYKVIEKQNSVCVSIRRGDFLDSAHKARHYLCDDRYFKKAIIRAQELIKDPQFIIFSDDIAWVKEHMSFPANTVFERGDDEISEKMRLMYSCSHFILSNSSFSWWAQYLCRNEQKIVIAPSRWQNYGYQPDIYEKTWELIKV